MPQPGPRPALAGPPPGAPASLADALRVLLDPGLAHVVELVAWREEHGAVRVANAAGECRFLLADALAARPAGLHREPVGPPRDVLRGQDPLARQDPLAAAAAVAERAAPHPGPGENDYPLAAPRLAQVFLDPSRAPDIVVVHTDAHHWPERGGHLGEHGSLSVRQSRAPLLLSGAAVRRRGVLPAAAQVVDVTPTLLHAAGLPVPAGLDGSALEQLVAPGADRVVALLWDGANCAAVLELAAEGRLPAVARLLDHGCALAGGAVAEFPSVTLVNHTSALTGLGPGRHGILHNVFYDRASGAQVLANDAATWHRACALLRPGVATLWEHAGAGVATACVNEPIDRGAGYSTFALVRQAGASDGARSLAGGLPDPATDPHASQDWVAGDPDYAWSTQIDAAGLAQMEQLFAALEPPALTWWNTTLTDTGHHGGGAHSAEATSALLDADRRLGAFLDLLDRRGLTAGTTFLLTADHGAVAADPLCRGDWDQALAAAGLAVRDEGYGFLYLG